MYLEERMKKIEEKVEMLSELCESQKKLNKNLILTVEEFSEVAKINVSTVYSWVRSGKIKKIPNLGTAIRIPMSQFDEYDADVSRRPIDISKGRKKSELKAKFCERIANL